MHVIARVDREETMGEDEALEVIVTTDGRYRVDLHDVVEITRRDVGFDHDLSALSVLLQLTDTPA